jgi:hypothetical protein
MGDKGNDGRKAASQEEMRMLPVMIRRVFLAEHRVDFRKGLDGLLGEAYHIGADPLSRRLHSVC